MKKWTDDRYLKWAFIIGGIYDIILGVGVLLFKELFSSLMNVALPQNPMFLYISGLFLILTGYFLIYSTQDVRKFAFIGFGSVIIRFAYAVIAVITYFSLYPVVEIGYLLAATTDSLTGIILLIPLLLTDGIKINKLWKFD